MKKRQREALERIAADDPELAAKLILMTLPATGRHVRTRSRSRDSVSTGWATANRSSA